MSEDIKRVRKLIEVSEIIKEFVQSAKECNNYLGSVVVDDDIINRLSNSVAKISEEINALRDARVDCALKKGTIISYREGDAVSYSELHFIKILEDITNKNEFDVIEVAKLIVGQGDSGKWIHYDSYDFIKYEDFYQIVSQKDYQIVGEEVMNKYIKLAETIEL